MNEAWQKVVTEIAQLIDAVTREWTKPRTVFTALFYGAYVYLILKGTAVPAELNTIISTLFGYWFGTRKTTTEGK
jgi:hypothetical protein